MTATIDMPAMHHQRHSRIIAALMASVTSGGPVIGYRAEETVRFLSALFQTLSDDPELCSRIERAAKDLR